MTIYYINRVIEKAYNDAQYRKPQIYVTESQKEAINLLINSLKGEVHLGAIQGPPGTGKTSVVELGIRQIVDDIVFSREKILVIYTAPTNHLVMEALYRFLYHLFLKGYNINQVLKLIRVYGSRIKPYDTLKETIINGKPISCDDFREVMGTINPNDTRFVFATEYQRIAPKIKETPDEIRYIVDEASKSPFFRVFLGIAQKIVKQPEGYYPKSLIVLGDPKQAITVQEEFKLYRVELLMNYVKRRLKILGLEDKYFKFLDTTFRLPGPTEWPISKGFYEGRLKAYEDFRIRYERLITNVIGGDTFNILRRKLSNVIDLSNSLVNTVFDAIETALSSRTPIIIFNTRPFPAGKTYEPLRAKIAYLTSIYLSTLFNLAELPLSVGVTAPYSDLAYNTGYGVRKRLHELGFKRLNVIATTVQAIIGGEADAIVTMLAKEWIPGGFLYGYPMTSYDIFYETMYFREYQVLNVQLSRHRLLLTVIGNITRLEGVAKDLSRTRAYREPASSIADTTEALRKDLHTRGHVLIKRISA